MCTCWRTRRSTRCWRRGRGWATTRGHVCCIAARRWSLHSTLDDSRRTPGSSKRCPASDARRPRPSRCLPAAGERRSSTATSSGSTRGTSASRAIRAAQAALWQAAERELPNEDVAAYTQGLMDLGATLCTRSRPRCARCPVSATCVALREQRIAELPAPRPRPRASASLRDAGAAAGRRCGTAGERAPSGIWGGLLRRTRIRRGHRRRRPAARPRAALRRRGTRAAAPAGAAPRVHALQLRDGTTRHRSLGRCRRDAGGLERVVLLEAGAAALPAPLLRLLQSLAPFALRAT